MDGRIAGSLQISVFVDGGELTRRDAGTPWEKFPMQPETGEPDNCCIALIFGLDPPVTRP
jgi:hypothetical protein